MWLRSLGSITSPAIGARASTSSSLQHSRSHNTFVWPEVKAKMAPIRRYLRITKYSVLECRIYLDSPALAQSWLLNPRDPILPKVIEAIRPLVIPKLREEKERERGKKKSAKKKTIKDVIVKGMFPRLHLCPKPGLNRHVLKDASNSRQTTLRCLSF